MLPGRDVECRAAVGSRETVCARRATDTLSSFGPLRRAERPDWVLSCHPPSLPRVRAAKETCQMELRTAWQERADIWVRWARSPDLDDDFWEFRSGCLPMPGTFWCWSGRPARPCRALP